MKRVAIVVLAAACTRGPVVVEEAPERVVCRRGVECETKWRRARERVVRQSHWPIVEDTAAVIATDGPGDTRDAAFVIHRVVSTTDPGTDVIVFAAGCTDRVRTFVDHLPARGGRWRNVTGPGAQYTECDPPVDELGIGRRDEQRVDAQVAAEVGDGAAD